MIFERMLRVFSLFLCVLPNISELYDFQTSTRFDPGYDDRIWFPDQSQRPADLRSGRLQLSSRLVVFQNDKSGEACEINPGEHGACVRLDLCETAIENLQRKIAPKICSFEGYMPVVCCQDQASRISSIGDQNTCPPLPDWAYGSLNRTGRKSIDKCLDYLEPLFPCLETTNGAETKYARADFDLCAIPPKFYFIIGGEYATLGEFPHMAALGYGEDVATAEWNCGGSLISENFILTAAHCMYSPQSGDVSFVRLGDVNINYEPDAAYLYRVVEIIPHPKYKSPDKYNDIALLRLDREVIFDAIVRPACLNVDELIPEEVEATGWGTAEFAGDKVTTLMKVGIAYDDAYVYLANWSKHESNPGVAQKKQIYRSFIHSLLLSLLRRVTLNVFPHSTCGIFHTPQRNLARGILDDQQICAGHYTKSRDTCQGDSGGPIQVTKQSVYCMYDLVGITSFGRACGTPGVPAVYTRVSTYVPWIESVVWP